jgi:hypothetical protein
MFGFFLVRTRMIKKDVERVRFETMYRDLVQCHAES